MGDDTTAVRKLRIIPNARLGENWAGWREKGAEVRALKMDHDFEVLYAREFSEEDRQFSGLPEIGYGLAGDYLVIQKEGGNVIPKIMNGAKFEELFELLHP